MALEYPIHGASTNLEIIEIGGRSKAAWKNRRQSMAKHGESASAELE